MIYTMSQHDIGPDIRSGIRSESMSSASDTIGQVGAAQQPLQYAKHSWLTSIVTWNDHHTLIMTGHTCVYT